ncbi:unnamed protein product [Clonostachys rosea f. rosea IK726]|uniref:Uncharacterized protein n=2 Tax=Bionectria ochroleuca TaxID=29856 RepID=A0A0B7K408_BIOOC|nr:unnamed protein product [Clonostachys rosea f. rosea IK726]
MIDFLKRLVGALNAIGFILGLRLTALQDDLGRSFFQARPQRDWRTQFEDTWHTRVVALIVMTTGALAIVTILVRIIAIWAIMLLSSRGKT